MTATADVARVPALEKQQRISNRRLRALARNPMAILGIVIILFWAAATLDRYEDRMARALASVINVVDLMTLQPEREHPHGLSDDAFDAIFTTNKPIVFNFHGYPWLIHRLTYRRTNHDGMHVRGYKEEGTTTPPFDMCVLNDLDRYHLFQDVVDRLLVDEVPGDQLVHEEAADHHGAALVHEARRFELRGTTSARAKTLRRSELPLFIPTETSGFPPRFDRS